jgi:hypothetical protein
LFVGRQTELLKQLPDFEPAASRRYVELLRLGVVLPPSQAAEQEMVRPLQVAGRSTAHMLVMDRPIARGNSRRQDKPHASHFCLLGSLQPH